MSNMVIAVGGTGQVLLHYYTQLFLIGSRSVSQPFRAVVIDGDDMMPSLVSYSNFFAKLALREGENRVPRIDYLHIEIPDSNNVRQALTASENLDPPEFHPVDAFFSRDAQKQKVRDGLFARPCLSAVVAAKWRLPKIALDGVDKIVILGSLIGGTGGGLIAPLIAEIQRRARSARMLAVLMGEYFQNSGGAIDAYRFPSNKLMAAHSIQNVKGAQLNYLCFIDPPDAQRISRDTEAEKKAEHLKWPTSGEPYWKALAGIATVLDQSTSEQPGQGIAELSPKDEKCPYAENWQMLERAWQRANSLSSKNVISNLARDAFAKKIWERKLFDLLGGYWEQVRTNRDLRYTSSTDLCDDIQEALKRWWSEMSLRFPQLSVKKTCPVGDLAELKWGNPANQIATTVALSSRELAAQTSAASLLFRAMRGGEAQ